MANVPGPVEQVAFLRDLQRLLGGGQFVAIYNFAVVLSLADLAVEHGDDSGPPMPIPVSLIATRFIVLYWGHVRPFPARIDEGASTLLSQNLGRNIALSRSVAQLQQRHPTVAETLEAGDHGDCETTRNTSRRRVDTRPQERRYWYPKWPIITSCPISLPTLPK